MARILVSGSSLEIRSTLALVLELGGHSCETTGDFEEAASLLREGAFDLVLAGYGEDISSNGSARYLKLVPLKTPVLFLSETAKTFERLDNGTFIGPPIPQYLLAFVQSVLEESSVKRLRRLPERAFDLAPPPVSKILEAIPGQHAGSHRERRGPVRLRQDRGEFGATIHQTVPTQRATTMLGAKGIPATRTTCRKVWKLGEGFSGGKAFSLFPEKDSGS